jgi:isoquinoline 1-oxidoreductase alpha subunit
LPVETLRLNVNGRNHILELNPEEPLLWVLRDDLGFTGTKFGCGMGACGACSVLIDNQERRSCRVPVGSVASGQKIVTVEGLAKGKKLSSLQEAFIEKNAFCCGFCTSGMLISATALLLRNPNPTRAEIIEAMDGNLCRCGSYLNIIEAIESVVNIGAPVRVE